MTGPLRALTTALAVTVSMTMVGTAAPSTADPTGAATAERDVRARSAAQPLRDLTIALDPGHQLGNSNHPRQINQPVPAGGFRKQCNTTGAATNTGVPEATVTFDLARAVKRRLEAIGATVRMTRNTNSERRWGPCINVRGRFGERVGARLMVSLHADGASSGHGFHVIAPTRLRPWTTDIAGPSLRLAKILRGSLVRHGVPRADYTAGGTGIDLRSDLGTLNMSDVPVAMIEIGNMRDARDARRMTSAAGQATYADAVVQGIRTYLRR